MTSGISRRSVLKSGAAAAEARDRRIGRSEVGFGAAQIKFCPSAGRELTLAQDRGAGAARSDCLADLDLAVDRGELEIRLGEARGQAPL